MNAKELENIEIIGKFNNGLAKVKLENNYTFINEEGKIFPQVFKKAYDFGYADGFKGEATIVQLQNNKWAYINKSGEIISREYEELSRFKKGIAIAKIGEDKYTYLNSNMKQLGVFKEVQGFLHCGYAVAMLPNEKFVILDKDGNISKFEYDKVHHLEKNFRSVRIGEFEAKLDNEENLFYFYKKEPKNKERLKEQTAFERNPHLVGSVSCFDFLDEEKLNKIKQVVNNEVYRAISAPFKLIPFMGNDEYANLLVNNLEKMVPLKQKEARKKLVEAYYNAKILDAKKDYEKSVGKIMYEMMNDELLNEK